MTTDADAIDRQLRVEALRAVAQLSARAQYVNLDDLLTAADALYWWLLDGHHELTRRGIKSVRDE